MLDHDDDVEFEVTEREFTLEGTLPGGLTVIEASAGTGKTYTLAALFVREIAHGRARIGEICVVTFTEAATAELKGRLRDRLADVLARLEGRASPPDPFGDDLAAVEEPERSRRRQRLETALADFDGATISTIHGFCQRLLAGAGDLAGADPTRDDRDVVEVVTDLVLARCDGPEDLPGGFGDLVAAVGLRLALPDARLAPVPGGEDTVDFVESAVDEVRRRRRISGRRSFDAMLADARDLVTDPRRGPGLVADLRQRFRLVLIDEFQDTDQVQWSLFRRAFVDQVPSGPAPVTTVIVGDPKQAIYRFRGAELAAYLTARRHAVEHGGGQWSLGTNYRSDPDLLAALDRLLAGATFGDPAIRFRSVRAGRSDTVRVEGVGTEAVHLRELVVDETADERHRRARSDLVAEIVEVLREATIVSDATSRRVRPSDIGVLVRSNDRAVAIVADLAAAGVPAVAMGRTSVLDSPAAHQWQVLITALTRPSWLGTAKSAAVGWFGDLPIDAVAGLGEAEETALLEWVRGLVDALGAGGVPGLLAAMRRNGFANRLLARPGGERDLTDVDHIAELLQVRTGGARTTPDRLASVLADLRRAGESESAAELFDRRIDRDDDTVKVLTVHKAKGLEFPVVFCPDLWSGFSLGGKLAHAVDPGTGRRLIDTVEVNRGDLPDPFAVAASARAEQHGEALRLVYVALTRARHRLVVWTAPGYEARADSALPLAELLGAAANGDLRRLARDSEGRIGIVSVPDTPRRIVALEPSDAAVDLRVAEIDRVFDRIWRVWSYSAIERVAGELSGVTGPVSPRSSAPSSRPDAGGAHAPSGPASGPVATGSTAATVTGEDPEIVGGLDEPVVDPESEPVSPGASTTDFAEVAGGPTFGTMVHELLEEIDFASEHLDADLVARSAAALTLRPAAITARGLAEGLGLALRTPLGGPVGATRLVDVSRRDRLDELEFHLPLGRLRAQDLAAVAAGGLDGDDPMRPWFEHAAHSGHDFELEGYLTGSIDLVARIDGRYVVADYKTNRLGDAGYGPDATIRAMIDHGYPLQALVYLVALHRFLARRVSDYDPDRHLVASAYLFLRGMRPHDPAGVVWWRPPTAVILDVDDLFTRGARR